MKKLFDFFTTYVTPILTVVLTIGFFYLLNQNNIQINRIDTLNKTLYDVAAHKHEIYKEIQKTQFKEDYYLNQLSNSTTLIMTMITLIVALGGLITFKSFTDKIKDLETNLQDQTTINQKLEGDIKLSFNRIIISNLVQSRENIAETMIQVINNKKLEKHNLFSLTRSINNLIYNTYVLNTNVINIKRTTSSTQKEVTLNDINIDSILLFTSLQDDFKTVNTYMTSEDKELFEKELKIIEEVPYDFIKIIIKSSATLLGKNEDEIKTYKINN